MKAKRILELRASVTELLSRLDPVSPQLSDEEWQMIGRKILGSVLKPAKPLDLSYKRIRVWMSFKTRPSRRAADIDL